MAVWSQLRSPRFALLLITLALCLIRATDQPGVDIGLGSTTATVVPGDLALAALAIVALAELARRTLPRQTWLALGSALVFCLLIIATGAANGATALVSGTKVAELAVLGLGTFALVHRKEDLEAIIDVLLLFTLVADVVGLVKFVTGGGGRQASFLGEHDFAALATLPLLYGLTLVFTRRRGRRAALAIVSGSIGCILGSALASLLGLYLGAAVLIGVALLRRRLDLRAFAVTAAVLAVVTLGTVEIRSGDFGFLQSWFGKPASRPGQYASSWSQRLIFAYIGGRIFLDRPILGTGWYGDLPPAEFVRYLPDAHRRFSDQPAGYFPKPDSDFIPQQTFDEILYELGIVGGLAMLALLVGLGRASARVATRAAGALAPLPAAWLAAAIGALAGEGLFGGTPLVAMFWLVGGVVLALATTPEVAE
jgi:O-Antigen ligase